MAKHLGTQKSIRFSDDELELLTRLAQQHGTIKSAVMAGLYALDENGNATLSAAVAAELEKMAKAIRGGLM
jgi:hypothetical protein